MARQDLNRSVHLALRESWVEFDHRVNGKDARGR